jgi:hypothetical protein
MNLDLSTFTVIHTALSLLALVTGLVTLLAMIRGHALPGIALTYLVTSIATSATGFGFPFTQLLPSHIVAIMSLLALLAVLYARYVRKLADGWRTVDAIGIAISVFFLVFVTIAQAFSKVAALRALAPTLKEPPFAFAQGINLLLFIAATVLVIRAVRRALPARKI